MVKTKYREYIVQYLVKNNKIIEELHTGSIFYYTKYDYCDNICKITHYSNSDVNSIPDDMIYNITISTDRNINKLML